MIPKYQLTKAAELETLPIFRQFIDEVCRTEGLDPDTCFDLKLATDEACTNIIQHGYANLNPGSIILTLLVDPGRVIIRLTDFGHPFEPSDAPLPDINAALEDRPMGGFGLYFIYQTMDGVAYEITEDGNTLTLTKQLTK